MSALLFVLKKECDGLVYIHTLYKPYVVLNDNGLYLRYDPADIKLPNNGLGIIRENPKVFLKSLIKEIIDNDIKEHVVVAIEFHKSKSYSSSKCKLIDVDSDIYNSIGEFNMDYMDAPNRTYVYDANRFYNNILNDLSISMPTTKFWGIKGKSRKKS